MLNYVPLWGGQPDITLTNDYFRIRCCCKLNFIKPAFHFVWAIKQSMFAYWLYGTLNKALVFFGCKFWIYSTCTVFTPHIYFIILIRPKKYMCVSNCMVFKITQTCFFLSYYSLLIIWHAVQCFCFQTKCTTGVS
jgi:hypothetical protein